MDTKDLISMAVQAMGRAYAPYSDFKVGAALLARSGRVYQGCNIENAAYTPTNCAERTAFFKAVSEGEREFEAICIVGGKGGVLTDYTAPCGVCRQVMMEFCDPETFRIILVADEDHWREFRLRELLPMGFGPDNLRAESAASESGVSESGVSERAASEIGALERGVSDHGGKDI